MKKRWRKLEEKLGNIMGMTEYQDDVDDDDEQRTQAPAGAGPAVSLPPLPREPASRAPGEGSLNGRHAHTGPATAPGASTLHHVISAGRLPFFLRN